MTGNKAHAGAAERGLGEGGPDSGGRLQLLRAPPPMDRKTNTNSNQHPAPPHFFGGCYQVTVGVFRRHSLGEEQSVCTPPGAHPRARLQLGERLCGHLSSPSFSLMEAAEQPCR